MYDGTRLLNLLGVEEDEKFTTKITCNTYRAHRGTLQYEVTPETWCMATCSTLCQLIDDPSLIIRKPRFNDEEMTFLRLLRKYGKVTRIKAGNCAAYITTSDGKRFENNIGELFEPGEVIDLDKMFGEEND